MNEDILKIALKNKPNFICIVPENRKEITTEGGLNLSKNFNKIRKIIDKFKKNKIRTSLFIDPNLKDIKIAKELNADCVELHTGKISNLVKSKKNYIYEYKKLRSVVNLQKKLGLKFMLVMDLIIKLLLFYLNLKKLKNLI